MTQAYHSLSLHHRKIPDTAPARTIKNIGNCLSPQNRRERPTPAHGYTAIHFSHQIRAGTLTAQECTVLPNDTHGSHYVGPNTSPTEPAPARDPLPA